MAEIRIEGKVATAFGDHLYLVFVNDAGQEFVIRGGPESDIAPGFSSIVTEAGVPIAASEDNRPIADRDNFGSQVLDLGGRDAEDVWQVMIRSAQLIGAAGIDYDILGPNSNSTIASILYTVGIDANAVEPNVPGINFFPGISDDLLNEYERVFTTAHTTDSDDILKGGNLNDSFQGGGGDDDIDGGAGNDDVAIFSGNGLDYNVSREADGSITVTHARGSMSDGTDTLKNIEIARFADGKEIDLTAAEVHGFTLLRPAQDFYTGTTNNGLLLLNWIREGDISYSIDILNDGTVTRPGGIGFIDGVLAYPANQETAQVGGVNLNGFVGFPEDILVEVVYSVSPADSAIADLVIFETDVVRYLFIGDGVDDRGGTAFGDPHLLSFDNVAFDFQAAGEFILARATSGPAYEVQARFVALSSAVSVTQAVATVVDGITVSLQTNGNDGLLEIDGVLIALADGNSVSVGSGSVSRAGRTIKIEHGNDDITSIDVFGTFLNVSPQPSLMRADGTMEGLLGNANGTPADDFRLADGTVLTTPVPVETLYGDFAASWTLSEEDSLLPGVREAYDAPDRIITIDSLPAELRAAAEAAVDARGITNSIIREAAILDFALTGNSEFIEAAALTDQIFNPLVDTVPVDPVSNPVLILTSDTNNLDEEDASNRVATLTVSRGDTEGDLVVNYVISGSGSAPVDNADFSSGVAFGSVVIADGEETATFNIEIVNDDLDEGPETFDVSISLEPEESGNIEILVSSVHFTVEDNDETTTLNEITGTINRDYLIGTAADDVFLFKGGNGDAGRGNGGNDQFDLSGNMANGVVDNTRILDWSGGDMIVGISFDEVHLETVRSSSTALRFSYGEDNDVLTITGEVPESVESLFGFNHIV